MSRSSSTSSDSNTASLMVFPPTLCGARGAPLTHSGLQVPIHEVDLLEAAKSLADVLRAHVADPVHGFELWIGCGENLVQPLELPHDRLNHELGQTRDASQDAVAARRGGVVESVQLPVVAEQLGQPSEVQQVL